MSFDNIPREAWYVMGFLVLLAFMEPGFWAILILIGMLYVARNTMENSQQQFEDNLEETRRSDYESEGDRPQQRRTTPGRNAYVEIDQPRPRTAPPRNRSSQEVFPHALSAVEKAGNHPDDLPVLPVDIGILSYKGDQPPVVHQDWAVADDVDYVQPYINLRLPQTATGRVKFELVDSTGNTLFVHEDKFNFQRGRNLIMPSARLPIHDALDLSGDWRLKVSADEVVLAIHTFEWDTPEEVKNEIRRHILEDGEISSELRAALAENSPQQMSLDDLLAYQDDEEAGRQSR